MPVVPRVIIHRGNQWGKPDESRDQCERTLRTLSTSRVLEEVFHFCSSLREIVYVIHETIERHRTPA